MSWRESLQPASFRGVTFAVFDAEVLFGRRNVLHEYPLRDDPFAEDLGRKAREYSINAFVIGDDYFGARDALMRAIEGDETPGTLVHPTLGSMLVIPKECRVKFNNLEGGIEYFTLTFVEAGSGIFPSIGVDTSFISRSLSTGAITDFISHFSSLFNVNGLQDFLHTNALQNLIGTEATTAVGGGTDFVSRIQNILKVGSFGTDNEDFTNINNSLGKFQESATNDIYEPESLGQKISTLITQASDVYLNQATTNSADEDTFLATVRPNNPELQALEAQKRLQAYGSDFLEVPLTTPERIQDAVNQQQLINLVINISLVEMIRVTSVMEFVSRQDALAIRDDVDEYLQAQILTLADSGEDVPYLALSGARTAMVKDINTRAATLKNKKYVMTADAMPALAFAYDHYDDAARDEEIVRRNKIRNPVFIPPHSSIEILV